MHMPKGRAAANAYARIGVQSGAMSASPHQLIVMLFDGAHAALRRSIWAIEQDDRSLKGTALTKAITIIEDGLRASLDKKKGGEIAERLDGLYEYMTRTLVRANLKSDAQLIRDVDVLLENISSAWKEIAMTNPPAAQPA